MRCTHLSLTNFRNYVRLELDIPPGTTLFLGDNAQGKSNLLEAIYFLATTKSLRATSDREIINWLAPSEPLPFARLMARIQRDGASVRVEIVMAEQPANALAQGPRPGRQSPKATRRGERRLAVASVAPSLVVKKTIKINSAPKRALDLIGLINVVMFSPQDIDLVQGPPQPRRRYLDITISQVDPLYFRTLAHYNKVLLQRNNLLRQIRDRHRRAEELYFWDQELARAGALLVLRRGETVAALDRLANVVHRQLTNYQERLAIRYRASLALGEPAPELIGDEEKRLAKAQQTFLDQLHQNRGRDVAYGMSLLGPHRDDLAFTANERDINIYGSRGQQRTVALSLKLAEAQFIQEKTGQYPILLLDDVMSELDLTRRRHVLQCISGDRQVLITASHLEPFEPDFLASITLFRIQQGAIERLSLPESPAIVQPAG